MIKNVILDVGVVLIDFCWESIMKKLGILGDDFNAVAAATVESPKWNEYDRSVMPDEEVLASFKADAPGHEAQIQNFWDNIDKTIVKRPYTDAWIKAMRNAGYKVYILSNYARRTYQLTREEGLNFLPLADGVVFSFETGHVKPEKEIYHFIMDKYGLKPEECVFIDDHAENLVYPKEIGWRTIQYHAFAQVEADLKSLGVCYTYE